MRDASPSYSTTAHKSYDSIRPQKIDQITGFLLLPVLSCSVLVPSERRSNTLLLLLLLLLASSEDSIQSSILHDHDYDYSITPVQYTTASIDITKNQIMTGNTGGNMVHAPLHVRSSPNLLGSYLPRNMRTSPEGADTSIHVNKHCSSIHDHTNTSKHGASSRTVGTQAEEEEAMRRETNAQAKEYYQDVIMAASISSTGDGSTTSTTTTCCKDQSDSFPKFLRYQVLDGKLLGKGAFSNVSEVRGFQHLNGGPPPFGGKHSRNKFPSGGPGGVVKSEPFQVPAKPTKHPKQTPAPPVSLGAFLQDNIKSSSLFLTNNKWVPSVVSRLSGTMSGSPFSPTSSPHHHHHHHQQQEEQEEDDEVLKESRDFIANHCFRNGGDARYAIKSLSKETMQDSTKLLQGIVDMAMEARILSNLTNHPNVIKMRAISQGGPFGGSDGFFIILDRLYDTLEQRLVQWKTQYQRIEGVWKARLLGRDPQGLAKAQLYENRLVAAFDLSSAIAYLHRNRILHRDLKPQNIGFDIRGDLKIFDFGLAKVMPIKGIRKNNNTTTTDNENGGGGGGDHDQVADENGRYAFTAMCGTMRYMAPEVGLGQNYNEGCDIFSFTILLWEIMALERPYGAISPEELQEQVWLNHRRPCLDSGGSNHSHKEPNNNNKLKRLLLGLPSILPRMAAPRRKEQQQQQGMIQPKQQEPKRQRLRQQPWASTPLQILMRRGWSPNPDERPRMKHVEAILRKECISFRNGDDSGLEHNQRRSTHVFHRSKTARTL